MSGGGASRRSPYAVLNLPCSGGDVPPINDEQIRNAYRRLSRLLHPDKRPPGQEREDAQSVFIELQHAYETLVDPVLRQAYDHYGHNGVATVRQNKHATDSLYRHLSELHDDGKPSEALDLLTITLEDALQKQHKKEWEYSADVEINMHANNSNGALVGMEWPEVTSSNVSLSASVPLPPQSMASPFPSTESGDNQPLAKQKLQLSIGGQSNIDKGLGATRGTLSATYKPVAQTSIASDLTVGRKHLETTLSSNTMLSNETGLSVKMTRQYELGSGKEGRLAFGFSSHRSLSIFQGRRAHAMFALGVGANLKMHYGILSLTTWGFSVDESEDDDDKPHITAKLTLGTQYPVALSVEQPNLFDTPNRSGKASISWSPLQGYKLRGMLNRSLSRRYGVHKSSFASKVGIGVEHTGLSGLKWIIRYEHPEGLSVSIPIFVSSFLSPGYWNRVLFISTLSFALDEALEELAGQPSALVETKSDATAVDPSKKLSLKMRANRSEQQWLISSSAKRCAEQQLSLMGPVAKGKRQREEAIDGLVILKATLSSDKSSLDAMAQLQYWVQDSRLSLPPSSKSLLPGLYDLRVTETDGIDDDHSALSELVRAIRDWTSRKKHCRNEVEDVVLAVRYKYHGRVFETEVGDCEALELPSRDAIDMGSSDCVS
ncbi:hypothetical protein ACHAXT_006815 [Thalassiosira profunda]